MKKVIMIIISVMLILVTFSGCFQITEGKIVDKGFIPAHTETKIISGIRRIGKTTMPYSYPVTRSYPDQWTITFENENEDGELKKRTVYVDESTYESSKIGDYFVYDKEKHSEEEKYTEERN